MSALWRPYCQMKTEAAPLKVVRTEGVYLTLEDGRRLIDGVSSWWTACHGYNHPHIVESVTRQLARMPHVMFGGLTHDAAERLGQRLTDQLPGDLNRVFFSDSGSVAAEVAMKIAVQYWINQKVAGKTRFISFQNAYHGDTTGAMSVCDPEEGMHAHFKGFLLEQYPQPIPITAYDAAVFSQFLKVHRDHLAGVIVEPLVQCAGGMKFHSAESLQLIRTACTEHQLPLIADEIATGFYRTGSLFACEQTGVVPDIMCIGKALTAGTLGLAATIVRDHIYAPFHSDDPLHALMHGPTFMANPLACTAANASLDLFESEPYAEKVAAIETIMNEHLSGCAELPNVVDVRIRGAIGVIQVSKLTDLDRLRTAFVESGVWVRPFGDIIYLMPPLSIDPQELNTLCAQTVRVTREWAARVHTESR